MRTNALKNQYKGLFEVDRNLDRLNKGIELLTHLNPLNSEKEKHKFYASKYTEEPQFRYPKRKFNAFKLQQGLFLNTLESINDPDIKALYQNIIYYYSNVLQCSDVIGEKKKFFYNSLRLYGAPKDSDVQNAKFILHFKNHEKEDPKIYSAHQAMEYFGNFVKSYDFKMKIKLSTSIAADAMVSNKLQTLFVKKNARFSENQLKTLANHEIGVHMVTTFNGLNQPLKIFSNGFPKNVETQEGLAVFSEYMCGALTLERLKTLAYRVLAADSLTNGFEFADTFDLLHNQYKLHKDKAYIISLRVHRGGGFTKDYLYLTGLKKVYDYYKKHKDLSIFLTGKVSLDQHESLFKMLDLGLVQKPIHLTQSYQLNCNSNKTIDFILENLR